MAMYFVQRTHCPACFSTEINQLYRCGYDDARIHHYLDQAYALVGPGIEYQYLQDAVYQLNECLHCGLIYQEYIPDDELMNILYERWIDPQLGFIRHEQQINTLRYYAEYAQEVMQMIAYFRQIPASLKIFDFGMGWGKWARMAQAFGCDVYGNELSPARINYVTAHGIKILAWDKIPQHQFDFINTEQVFEHLPEPLETLLHLKGALKPGGLLKISVPDGADINRRLAVMDWHAPKGSKNSLNPVSPLEHINCFKRSTLVKMAAQAGLQEAHIPLAIQYAFATNWQLPKPALKNLLLPFTRTVLRRGTYLLFRHAS